jgi:SAM-dependent methyltransferase
MQPVDPAVIRHYDTIREEDRISTGFGQLELLRTQEVLLRHLPPPPSGILDVGGATGVHANWLADLGYRVEIVDITPRHVEKANADLATKGVKAQIGDARQLVQCDDTFDAALLFGPIYHLVNEDDRILALREARRTVRHGGVVAIAAVSRFASLFDGLAREFLFDPEFATVARNDLISGQHRNPGERANWWTTAYLHHPDQLRLEAEKAGLVVRELVGLEGLAGFLPQLAPHWGSPNDRDMILWAARVVETEPTLIGLSAHLLLIAENP